MAGEGREEGPMLEGHPQDEEGGGREEEAEEEVAKGEAAKRGEEEEEEEEEEGNGSSSQEEEKDPTHEEDEGEEEEEGSEEEETKLDRLLCFSSLQTMLAMELCRESTPSLEGGMSCSDNSMRNGGGSNLTLAPLAFLKLMLMESDGAQKGGEGEREGGEREEGEREKRKREEEEAKEREGGGKENKGSRKRPRDSSPPPPPNAATEWSRIERRFGSIDPTSRDIAFRKDYGVSYNCFLYLVQELCPFLRPDKLRLLRPTPTPIPTPPLDAEHALAIALHRFACGLDAPEIAQRFGITTSTVDIYTLIVASTLADTNKLLQRYVAIPTGDRLSKITARFEQLTNLPNLCGAITSTRIAVQNSKLKQGHESVTIVRESPCELDSIVLQGVCDVDKIFWDVECYPIGEGPESPLHFATSDLYKKIKGGSVSLQKPAVVVEGREVRPYLAATSGFPLRPFCIKPFNNDDALRKAFDGQLNKGSACAEMCFASLKARWKILGKPLDVSSMYAPQIAIACCVLHNICQIWGDLDPLHHNPSSEVPSNTTNHKNPPFLEVDEVAKAAGEAIRETLFRGWVKRSLGNSW